MRRSLKNLFCNCVKAVTKKTGTEKSGIQSAKLRHKVPLKRSTLGASSVRFPYSAGIPICVKSVLGSRGKTLKKFRCKKRKGVRGFLRTQKPIN